MRVCVDDEESAVVAVSLFLLSQTCVIWSDSAADCVCVTVEAHVLS